MNKFLSVIVLLTTIIFVCGQNNFASAREVHAGNINWMGFYVDTNSISLEHEMSFYVNVKKYDKRNRSFTRN